MNQDKPLPSSPELERAVIAGLMLSGTVQDAAELNADLRPSMFYDSTNRHIYNAISRVLSAGRLPDFVTVSAEIAPDKIGAAAEILAGEVTSTHTGQYIDQLREISLRRGLVVSSAEINRAIEQGGNPVEVYERFKGRLDELSGKREVDLSAGIKTMADFQKKIHEYRAGKIYRGLNTGWRNLDEYWRLSTQTLNIITGIPMSGKSEWLDHLAINSMVSHGWRWAVFSPESYPIELHFQKLAEKIVGKPFFGHNAMSEKDVQTALNALSEHFKLLVFGDEETKLDSILQRAKYCVEKYSVKALIIDPYNAVCNDIRANDMGEHIARFLNRLRNFGRIYDIAVFLVAHPTKLQRKRGADGMPSGEYPVPTPYDISGSAHFRNMADSCISIWRELDPNSPRKNTVQVHIQKVKNKNIGKNGMIELKWDYLTGRFEE